MPYYELARLGPEIQMYAHIYFLADGTILELNHFDGPQLAAALEPGEPAMPMLGATVPVIFDGRWHRVSHADYLIRKLGVTPNQADQLVDMVYQYPSLTTGQKRNIDKAVKKLKLPTYAELQDV